MTQAFSRLLVRQRPLLALAVVAALFAAAIAALAPASAQQGSQQTITWDINLALRDVTVPPDGIYQKGDAPTLLVVVSAAITPDANDQAGGGITAARITTGSSPLTFGPETSLGISGGQGIEFQLGPNSQIDRLRGGNINTRGTETAPFACETADDGAKSDGSQPATATCTIDTGILVSIPQTVSDGTYIISGRVNFSLGSLSVDYMQQNDDGSDEDDRSLASSVFSSGAAARTYTGSELNKSRASFSLPIGPVAAVDSVSFLPANKCIGATGPNKGLDIDATPEARDTTTCAEILRTSGARFSHFELKILNSANRGVVKGQIAAVVATLVRGADSSGPTAIFAACPGGSSGSQTCNPDVKDAGFNTASSIFTVRAPATPGSATLRIQVLPTAGGTQEPEPRTLTFTGPATSIELPEEVSTTIVNRDTDAADATLDDLAKGTDSVVLAVIPKDANGNTVAQPGEFQFELTGPDSRRVSAGTVDNRGSSGIIVDQGPTPSTADTDVATTGQVLIDVTAPATKPLMTGEYTLVVKRPARNLRATIPFTVVGPAGPPGDNLNVVKGDECTNGRSSLSEVGCTFEITVTVTDSDGNNVADGTDVALSATNTDGTNAQNLILSGSGADSTRTTQKTKAGVATVSATTVGNGEVLIVATAEGGSVSGSDIVDTRTDASGAGAESNVLACLSKVEVGEFSTYICDATLTADALFSVLRNRGADAIYLRSVGTWVRYATDASGTPLPGSSDNFTAVQYDTLFIGG